MDNRKTRATLYRDLSPKGSELWKEFKSRGLKKGLPFETLLRKASQPAEGGELQSVLYDFMNREDMLPESSNVRPALKVEECLNTPFRANLLFAHWDKIYRDTFWRNATRNQNSRSFVSTVDELTPGSIYRPYGDPRPVRNANRRTPDIALADLIAQVVTQDSDMVRGTSFEVDNSAGNLVVVPERGPFPEISFQLDEDSRAMKKIGIQLASSRESKLRESYVQTVDRVIEQVAQLQERALAVQAAKMIYDAWDTTVNPIISGVAENINGIVQVNTSGKNGYNIDTLIMGKNQFRDWVSALTSIAPSGGNASTPGTENRVPGVFGSVEVLNDLQAGHRIGYFDSADLTTIGLADNRLLGFERGMTLDFYQQTQGMVDEETYLVETQEWKRVISMIYGQKIFDHASIQVFQTA